MTPKQKTTERGIVMSNYKFILIMVMDREIAVFRFRTREEARNEMKSFSDDFAELRKSIIDSSMEILQPAKTVIGIPSMKPKKKSIAENYFIEHITGKISELLESEIVTVTDIGKEVNQAKVSKEELVSFVRSLLRKWNFENLDKEVENEKYAFRCFLLRLGFIGDDNKTARRILLQNLSGNSAFRKA